MDIRAFLEKDYQRIKALLASGTLFSAVRNEESTISRAVEHLENASEQLLEQQRKQIDQKFRVKMSSIESLLGKLKVAGSNLSVLNKDDISRLESALSEMLQILDVQKRHELTEREEDSKAKRESNVSNYLERTEPTLVKHFSDAKAKMEGLLTQLGPLDQYYETAAYDSGIWESLSPKHSFPSCNSVRLGESTIQIPAIKGEEVSLFIPEIVPFFAKSSLTITYKSSERQMLKGVVDSIVTRSLMSSEAGNIRFYFMDGNNNGSLFFDYLKCDPRTLELFNGKLFVTGSEIESILLKLQQDYNEIDQNLRKGDPIEAFNSTHPKSSIPYRVVIMDSFPKGINATYIPIITKLVKNEIAAGLHFVFLVEEQDLSRVSELASLTTVFALKPNLRKTDTSLLSRGVLDYVSKAYNQEKAMLFEEYYDSNVDWWKDTAANYTIIPLGMHRAVNYNLVFNEEGKDGGVSSANAVIVGMPGSGKSCLLHTMIVGSSIKYSPNELRFYMIDLKAVEFKQYEVERLPHAEFVALKANPEFGFHILQVICKKIKEREQLFNDRQVKNYLGYRNAFPEDVLPRYMVFIDEYQELLRGELRPAVISRLDFIIRVGRALGFNLILSSQTMDLPAELVGLISHRIAMRSTTAAARSVLDFYDERAPQLNTGQAIIHAETTDLVQSYYLPEDAKGKPANATKLRADYLRLIREKWEQETRGRYEHNLVVFDREMPALLGNNKTYRKMSVVKDAYDVFFSPGEKIMIDGEDLMCRFTRMRNDNLMVLGGKAEVSVRTLNGCLMSMLPQLDPKEVGIDIVNLLNLSQASLYHEIENSSRHIEDKFAKASYTTDCADIDVLFDDILADIDQRSAKMRAGEYVAPRFLVIYRLENDPEFHEIVTQSYGMESSEKSELTNKLIRILGSGPEVGLHSLVHFNDPASFFAVLDAKSNDKHFFNHRLLLQMQEDESKHFLDSFSRKDASELVDKEASEKFAYNLALYYNAYDQNEPIKIKPYEFLNINQ